MQPLSTRLIKPNFCFDLSHRRSTTVSLETRNPVTIQCCNIKVSFKVSAHLSTTIWCFHNKYGFLLAEEREKRKKVFPLTAGSLGTSVWWVSGHMACVRFQFLFCHWPSPDMPCPPTCDSHDFIITMIFIFFV